MPKTPKKRQVEEQQEEDAIEHADVDMNGDGHVQSAIESGKLPSTSSVLKTPSTEKEEYESLCQLVNAISQPLASRKLAKKAYKLISKASKQKGSLRQGLSDVQKAIRKDEKGIVVLAGNVSPIDVYSHIPALCEEKELPYVYTPSREHLGLASGHRRPSIALLIKEHEEYAALYQEVANSIASIVVEVGE